MSYQIKLRIKVLCAERDISMRALSRETGITPKTLSLLASGKTQGIRYTTLIKIIKTLDCSLEELFIFEEGIFK